MSYCLNMIVLTSFPFKVWIYYSELGNSIFMCTISPIMGNALPVCCKSLTPVEASFKWGVEFSAGFWRAFKEGNLMTPVSSDDWLEVWQKRMCLFSFTVCGVLHEWGESGVLRSCLSLWFSWSRPLLWVFLFGRVWLSVPALIQRERRKPIT